MHHGYRHADDDYVREIALSAYGSPDVLFELSSFARLNIFAAFVKDDAGALEEQYLTQVGGGNCSRSEKEGTRKSGRELFTELDSLVTE